MLFRGKFATVHPALKTLLWIILMVAGGLVWMLFQMLLTMLQVPFVPMFDIMETLQSVLIFIVPACIAAACWSERPMEWLHISVKSTDAEDTTRQRVARRKMAALVVVLMVVALPGINLISYLNQQVPLPELMKGMEEQMEAMLEQVLRMDHAGMMVLNLVVMALMPALGEELCFRGVCFGLLDRNHDTASHRLSGRTHLMIWVVGALFSFIHFQFAGFVPRMLLGALFGYLLCWSGSIWIPVLAHFINNSCVVVAYYLSQHSTINADSIDNFGTGETLWVGILSICLTALLIWALYIVARRQSSAPRPAAAEE